jgi:hypothetical protein
MSQKTVRSTLTRKRPRRHVEDDAYSAFTRRIVAAFGRRIANGDVEDLRLLASLSSDVDTALREAVTGLRSNGFTWTQIADRLGVTKQSAQERFGTRADRNALDPRLLSAGLGVTVAVLVDVFADHHPGSPPAPRCPACHYRYPQGVSDCPTNATVRPILYRRRHEEPQSLKKLAPDQYHDLHDKKAARTNRQAAKPTPRSTSDGNPETLLDLTDGGDC